MYFGKQNHDTLLCRTGGTPVEGAMQGTIWKLFSNITPTWPMLWTYMLY
jgi:hypothetical protein